MGLNIMDFIHRSRKVFYAFYKPTWSEIKETAFITGLGMIIIGAIGYILFMIFHYLLA